MIGIVAPTDSGLPGGRVAALLNRSATIPTTGMPVLIYHGPISMRAALGVTPDYLLVRPLAPLVPSARLRRDEITAVEFEDGHWYAFGRRVICIRRAKGPSVRLAAPSVPGVPDSTDNLGYLLRAWWRAKR